MNNYLSYCKRYYHKQRNIFLGIFFLILMIFYLLWGPKVINYILGAQDINNTGIELYENDHAFFSLADIENKYVKKTFDKISQGVADQVKGGETVGIFYLYSMDNGMYMVVYADKDQLLETENLYYQLKEQQDVTPITLRGGFAKIDDDVKSYAYEYLNTIDESKYTSIEDMENVLLPYVFVSNQIGETPIFIIEIAFYIFLFFILLIPVFIYLNANLSNLHTTKDCIQRLSKENQKIIDKDFKESKKLLHFKVGKKLLFYENMLLCKVFSYKNIIWIYKEKNTITVSNSYSLHLYLDDGSHYKLMLGNDMNKISKLMNIIQKYQPNILIGYQVQLADKYKISKKEFLKLVKEMKTLNSGDKKNEKN